MENDGSQNRDRTRGLRQPFKTGEVHNPKGNNGNLGAMKCKKYSDEALQVNVAIMRDKRLKANIRAQCAQWIYDHAWGKATQPVGGDPDKPPIDLNIIRISCTEGELATQ